MKDETTIEQHILNALVRIGTILDERLSRDEHDAAVAAQALRRAAEAMRMVSEPTTTLLPAQDADETWYSPDVWLDHEADRIERGETDADA